MATTVQAISAMLELRQIEHHMEDKDKIIFGVRMTHRRDSSGEFGLVLVIQIMEEGEYFKIFAPAAYKTQGPHAGAALAACMQIQWRTQLIQFEYDTRDGEIRPVVEFPLEDAELTPRQLFRCIDGLCKIIDRYDEALINALMNGVVDLPCRPGPPASDLPLAGAAALLRAIQAEGRSKPDPILVQLRVIQAGETAVGAPNTF